MTIPNPTLDDVTYDELLNSARKNIAIFSKQWTNYNESDPGITLLELLCWLVDNQTYSLNRITKKNYKKFLKLLGVQSKVRRPAKFNTSFTCNDKAVAIPAKTVLVNSLSLPHDDDRNKEDILLETDEKLDVVPASLKNISVVSNFGISDKTDLFSKKPISCFGNVPRIGNTFLLGLDTNYKKKATLNIFFELEHEKLDTYPFGDHCNDNKFFLSSELEWRYSQKGISVHNWPLLKVIDNTNSLTKDGIISLEIPFDKISPDDIHKTNSSLCWISCTLKNGTFEIPPKIKSIYLNSVLATQHRTVTETIRNSNGWPDQHFVLSNKPLFDVLQVHVSNKIDNHNGDTFGDAIEWKRVDDFDTSGPDDLHYVVDYDDESIVFGNGFHGDIPKVASNIVVSYTYGTTNDEHLDSKDNSVALKLSDHKTNSDIKNIKAKLISKSSHGETLQDAAARTRKEMQIPFKAVNHSDYEHIAKNTPGLRVARIFAIPDEQKNKVSIVAVPYSPLPNPLPSKGFLQTLSAHIEKHRPLTTKISVMPPNYIEISISTGVTIDKRANEKSIKENILSALNSFLSPIGEDGGWEIGRPVHRSELYAIIKKVKGVIRVSPPYIMASGKNNTFRYTNDMIWIDQFSLVYPGIHSVTTEYEQRHPNNMEKKSIHG